MSRNKGITVIVSLYALTLVVTIVGFALLSHILIVDSVFWISLTALLLAETLFWSLAAWGSLRGEQFASTVPAFMAQIVVAGIYAVLVIAYMLILWLLFHVSASFYGWLQLATFVVVAGVIALISWFMQSERHVDEQDRMQRMGIADIRQGLGEASLHIQNWQEPYRAEVRRLLSELEDSVRFSDPVTHPEVWKEEERLTDEVHQLRDQMMQMPNGDEQQVNVQLDQLRQHFQLAHEILRQRNARLAVAKS
ncbi:hypothetical protein ACE3MZ_06005 [Paenibacillus sp. WLX1005]|uniref:hypothetical protein n=1 Tax=Paenibacillus sp. WLX1005 TaxID=3243766 RepID=UPI003983DFD9